MQRVSAFLLSVFNKMKLMKINCFAVPAVGDRNAGSVIFRNCASETSVEGVLPARNRHHLHKIAPRKRKQPAVWIWGARCTAGSGFYWAQENVWADSVPGLGLPCGRVSQLCLQQEPEEEF